MIFRCHKRADLLRRAWFCHRHGLRLLRDARRFAALHRYTHDYRDAVRSERMRYGARAMFRRRDEFLALLRSA